MLRLLARTVGRLWQQRPADAYAVHLHHLDPAFESIRHEIVTRLGQNPLVPALKSDVAAIEGDQRALAQQLDADQYQGLAPYGSYVARAIFFHTLAFNEALKGATPEDLRYAILSPGTDLSFIDDARRRFVQHSAYLDDRPNVPLRFNAEANLTQILRREEQRVDPEEARAQLNDRIKGIFSGSVFTLYPFPGGPYEVPDDAGDDKPALVLLGYDAVDVAADNLSVPDLVSRIYTEKDASGGLRLNRNQLVFLLADHNRKVEMKARIVRRLALNELRRPERLSEFPDHQQDKIKEWYQRSEQEVALAIQQCYRHLANNKLRLPEDEPDAPTYIRDRTPLKKGRITTAALRAEFRRDPALPILVGHDCFIKGIRRGIEQGEYVYQSGDLIFGMGDPWANIHLDEQSFVYTRAYALEYGLWPKAAEPPPGPTSPVSPPGVTGTVAGTPGTPTSPGTPTGAQPGAGTPTSPGTPGGPGPSTPVPPGRGPGTGTAPATATPPAATTLTEEGVLKEALTQLWERARSRRFSHIRTLELRLFVASDAFRLLSQVSALQGATKQVFLDGGYETTAGGTLQLDFTGSPADAQPLKDFLEPQLRAAKDQNLSARFLIQFAEAGLPLAGNTAEQLTERLTRFGTGAAYVAITAEGAA